MNEQAGVLFVLAAAGLIGAWVAHRWVYLLPTSAFKEAERAHRRNMQVMLIAALLFLGVTFAISGAVAL